MKLLSGNANPSLAQNIARELGVSLCEAKVGKFSDGEISVSIGESVRGEDVFVIQPICKPVNDSLMELLVMLDGLKRASPSRITAVVPYYAYGRQDRKIQSRDPISAKLVADLISCAGAQRILAVDLHADQIQGFFDLPVDNLTAAGVLAEQVQRENIVIISPDVGGVVRARAFAKHFGAPIAIIDKRRPRPNENEVLNVVGDIEGKNAIIFDDMIDTGGTLAKAASALVDKGALSVTACASHGVFSGKAFETLGNSKLEQIVVTDSIPLASNAPAKIKQVPLAPLLAQAIKRVHEGKSLSELFKNG